MDEVDGVDSRAENFSYLRDLACNLRRDDTKLLDSHDLDTDRKVAIDTVAVDCDLHTSCERAGGIVGLEAGGGGLSTSRRMFGIKSGYFDFHVVDRRILTR